MTEPDRVILESGENAVMGSIDSRDASTAPSGDEFRSLLGSAGRGNKVALSRIHMPVAGRLAGYLRAQGYSDPEGAVNEVFLRILPRLADFKGDESRFRSWLFSIAHNMLIDERRQRSRRPE